MMTPEAVETAAVRLDEAERTRTQVGLLSLAHPGIDMDDAYAIQAAWIRRKLATGRRRIGWKIGLTSKAMQSALNIDIPDSGVLLDDMMFANGATIPPDRFIQPRIEAEIAFVMKASLAGPDVTPEDVIAATDYVQPSLEILDTRILRVDPATKKARTVFDTIAEWIHGRL
jgi:2-oxo-hept-3-ene-1,7-dioate hydratase